MRVFENILAAFSLLKHLCAVVKENLFSVYGDIAKMRTAIVCQCGEHKLGLDV